jgi:hypothetical protein
MMKKHDMNTILSAELQSVQIGVHQRFQHFINLSTEFGDFIQILFVCKGMMHRMPS